MMKLWGENNLVTCCSPCNLCEQYCCLEEKHNDDSSII